MNTMNRQELIEALEESKNNIQFIVGMNKYNNFLRGKKEAYVNAIGLAKQLDEPQKQELTDEEVLELVSTHFRFDKDNFWKQLNEMSMLPEPQKTVVPKCAELFLKIAQDSTDVIQLFDSIIYATESDGLILEKWGWSVDFYDWLAKDSDTLYILCDALRYGYEVEKELSWVVKRFDGTIVTQFALCGLNGKNWCIDTDHPNPLIFTNKEKADAVALLVDGEVVEG